METFDPQLIGILSIVGGVCFAMVWLAAHVNMLELKRAERRCPACGLVVRRPGACACSE